MTKFNLERFSQAWAVGKLGESAFKEQCKIWDMTILFEAPANQVFYPYNFLIQYNGTYEKEKYPDDLTQFIVNPILNYIDPLPLQLPFIP